MRFSKFVFSFSVGLLAACDGSGGNESSKTVSGTSSTSVPAGFKFAGACLWTFSGANSGNEQNCDEMYFDQTVSSAERERQLTAFNASCLKSAANKTSTSTCPVRTTTSCKTEYKGSQYTGNPDDAVVYMKHIKYFPEANSVAKKNFKADCDSSLYTCSCTSDLK